MKYLILVLLVLFVTAVACSSAEKTEEVENLGLEYTILCPNNTIIKMIGTEPIVPKGCKLL